MSDRTCGQKIFQLCLRIPGFRPTLDFIGLTRELPLQDEEKSKYLEKLKTLGDERRFVFGHFYSNLDVLDNKANSLIQFTSVIIATYVAIFGYVDSREHLSISSSVKPFGLIEFPLIAPVIVGFFLSFFSALLFLIVEKVHWSSPDDLLSEDIHSLRLLDVRNKRTIRYRLGWGMSFISMFVLAASIYIVTTAPPSITERPATNARLSR